jgi:hypothetical protein
MDSILGVNNVRDNFEGKSSIYVGLLAGKSRGSNCSKNSMVNSVNSSGVSWGM